MPILNYVVVNWITSNELFFKSYYSLHILSFLKLFSCFLLRKQTFSFFFPALSMSQKGFATLDKHQPSYEGSTQQVICLRLSPSLAPTHNIHKSLLCYPHSCFSFSLTASERAFPLCQQLQSFHRCWWLVASAITCNINFFLAPGLQQSPKLTEVLPSY